MKYLLKCLVLLVFVCPVFADTPSPVGEWLGYYEGTDIPGAKVKVTLNEQGILNAYVQEVYAKPGETVPSTCVGCPGKFNNQPLKNLPMLWDLKAVGNNRWEGGHGFSLERKKIFSANVWLSEDGETLYVRGRVGIFGKTQHLKRLTSG